MTDFTDNLLANTLRSTQELGAPREDGTDEREPVLHVYEFNDGMDFFIATSEDDARLAFREHYGLGGVSVDGDPTMAALDEDEIADQLESLYPIPDDRLFGVVWNPTANAAGAEDDEGNVTIELTAAEWAVKAGRGWFCGRDC